MTSSVDKKYGRVKYRDDIIKSEIGLAVKDLSEAEIKKLYIADSNIGNPQAIKKTSNPPRPNCESDEKYKLFLLPI